VLVAVLAIDHSGWVHLQRLVIEQSGVGVVVGVLVVVVEAVPEEPLHQSALIRWLADATVLGVCQEVERGKHELPYHISPIEALAVADRMPIEHTELSQDERLVLLTTISHPLAHVPNQCGKQVHINVPAFVRRQIEVRVIGRESWGMFSSPGPWLFLENEIVEVPYVNGHWGSIDTQVLIPYPGQILQASR